MMHVDKNICNSLIRTLINILGKNKDRVKVRLNLVNMVIQSGLALEKRNQHVYLPFTCCTLSEKEKTIYMVLRCYRDIFQISTTVFS